MNNSKPATTGAIEHCGGRTSTHARDKAQAEERALSFFVAVAAEPLPVQKRDFSSIVMREMISTEPGVLKFVSDRNAMTNFLKAEKVAREHYSVWGTRHGVKELMHRKDRLPLTVTTVSVHPAALNLMQARMSRGERGQPMADALFKNFIENAAPILAKKRWVAAFAGHWDTPNPHVDCITFRNFNGLGGKRFGGGLGLGGPWTVATSRQIEACRTYSGPGERPHVNPIKAARFEANMAKFLSRYGSNAVMMDLKLATEMDRSAAAVFGSELKAYIDDWAQGIPEREKAMALAMKRNLESAIAKLDEMLAGKEPTDGLDRRTLRRSQGPAKAALSAGNSMPVEVPLAAKGAVAVIATAAAPAPVAMVTPPARKNAAPLAVPYDPLF